MKKCINRRQVLHTKNENLFEQKNESCGNLAVQHFLQNKILFYKVLITH